MTGALLTLLTAIAFAAGPFLFPNFAGFAPDAFPVPQNDPPIQPAGYAFAIWGPIYLWLVGSALFGLWRRARDASWAAMRPALILSQALGAAWLALAQGNPVLATVMIWAMWLTAVGALYRAPRADRSLVAWPIGLYAGWLTAASCVATGLLIAGYGILDEQMTALVMLGFALCLAAGVQLTLRRAPTFGVAVIWALVGIYAANDPANPHVMTVAGGGAIAMAAMTLLAVLLDLRRRPARA